MRRCPKEGLRLFWLSDSIWVATPLIREGANPKANQIALWSLIDRPTNRIVPERGTNVMPNALDRQKAAYFQLRPQIVADKREGWALVAREALVDVFAEFDVAASYAVEYFPNEDVLIRHTSEHRGIAPFIVSKR